MAYNKEYMDSLFEQLKLDESFKDMEFGGILDDLILTFRLPATTDNKKILDDIFGKRYENMFPIKMFTTFDDTIDNSDGSLDECEVSHIVPADPYDASSFEQTVIDGYNHYVFKKSALISMSNEQLEQVVNKSLAIVQDSDNPCPYDQLLIIIVIVGLTIASLGQSMPLNAVLLSSMVISVGQTMNAFGDSKNTQMNLSYLSAALAVAGGYGAYVSSTGSTIAATCNFALVIANSTLSVVGTYVQTDIQKDIKAEIDKQNELNEELEAITFEKKIRYTYEDSYDSTYREGHEKDPYDFIHAQYRNYGKL